MAKQKKENSSFLSTVYLIILFAVGISVGLNLQHTGNTNKKQIKVRHVEQSVQKPLVQTSKQNQTVQKNDLKRTDNQVDKNEQKQETKTVEKKQDNGIVQKLENELVTVLVTNNILQQDIITQYAKEIEDKKIKYTQYYKEINLPKNKKFDTFDYQFKTLARNCKIDVSKVPDENLGMVTYSFYDKDRVYSVVVFKKSGNK